MQCVIVNKDGHLYGGFETEKARPVWYRSKRAECVMDEPTCDTVMRQLAQLGFKDFAKRDAQTIAKKWVPETVDAAKLL